MVRVSASSAKDLRQFKRQRSVRDEMGRHNITKRNQYRNQTKKDD